MSATLSPHARRLAALAAALLLAAAPVALAGEPPAPPPMLDFGFIQHVVVGTPSPNCDGCPPRVCPDQPYPVFVSGVLPSPCIVFRGFRELPVAAPFTVLAAEFSADTCNAACPAVQVPFSAMLTMPPTAAGPHFFELLHVTRGCPDSSVAEVLRRTITYQVETACEPPPPPPPPSLDSLAKRLVRFDVMPLRRCDGDSLTLEMSKNGCPPCVDLVSLEFVPITMRDPAGGIRAVVEWRAPCVELACFPETLRLGLGRFAAGFHQLSVDVDVRVLRAPAPDTTISFRKDLRFEVPRTCDTTGCVFPWLAADVNARRCALEVAPGKRSALTLSASTPVELGGLQGLLECSPPFRIVDVRPPAWQPRFHVSWVPEGRGARYVLFTSGGEVIPAGHPRVLELAIEADATASIGERGGLAARLQVASGPGGEDVPLCDTRAVRFAPIPLCVATPADSCDVNGDGRADVRDLVRMTRCLSNTLPPADSATICRDCTGDGAFTFSDLVCCARYILRGPFAPRDSVRANDALRVTLDPLEHFGNGWLVRVRVSGAEGVAGAMLRLRYPADRWRADIPLMVGARAGVVPQGWFPLIDPEEPGVVQLGGLRLEDSASGDVQFEFVMTPTGTPREGDRLEAEGADMVATDGTLLTPSAPLPAVSLTSPELPPGAPARIELGPAKPNPFARSTSFSVSLPREAQVDVSVHDIAGRRIETLASGRLPAGRRDFTWAGTGARDGLYFVRLTVDGRVYSSRVALLRDGR